MNKKGDFMEFFGDFVTIIIVAIILSALFFITSSSLGKKDSSKIIQIHNNIHPITLLNLMRTPYSFEENYLDTNIADLLVYSYKSNDFSVAKEIINSKMKSLFDKNDCLWSLNVYDKDKLIFSTGKFESNNYYLLENPNIRIANITLPINETNSLVVFYGDNLIDNEYGKC